MKWRTDDEQRPLSQTPNHRSNLSVDLSPFRFIVDLRCEIIRFEIHRGVIKIWKKSFPKFLNFVNLFLWDNWQKRFLRNICIIGGTRNKITRIATKCHRHLIDKTEWKTPNYRSNLSIFLHFVSRFIIDLRWEIIRSKFIEELLKFERNLS